MYQSFPQFVYGFYGCDRAKGESVIAGGVSLSASRNTYDWLGHGIYFWENAPARALKWALDCMNNPKKSRMPITHPFVLGAVIDLGHCLNLADRSNLDILREAYQGIILNCQSAGVPPPQNHHGQNQLDCLVINAAMSLYAKMNGYHCDSVRGVFIEGNPIYNGARLYEDTHIQICIRNPNCIKGYFLPRFRDDNFSMP